MKSFRFRDWNIYKEAKELFGIVLKIVNALPKEYKYSVGGQLIRAALSVILNIAEGSGKSSDRELNRFFDIAIGSLYEVLAAVDTLHDLGMVKSNEFKMVYASCDSIVRQLGGFKKKIKTGVQG